MAHRRAPTVGALQALRKKELVACSPFFAHLLLLSKAYWLKLVANMYWLANSTSSIQPPVQTKWRCPPVQTGSCIPALLGEARQAQISHFLLVLGPEDVLALSKDTIGTAWASRVFFQKIIILTIFFEFTLTNFLG